jgi:hypothetical protein
LCGVVMAQPSDWLTLKRACSGSPTLWRLPAHASHALCAEQYFGEQGPNTPGDTQQYYNPPRCCFNLAGFFGCGPLMLWWRHVAGSCSARYLCHPVIQARHMSVAGPQFCLGAGTRKQRCQLCCLADAVGCWGMWQHAHHTHGGAGGRQQGSRSRDGQ